jgi:hypothetical protein
VFRVSQTVCHNEMCSYIHTKQRYTKFDILARKSDGKRPLGRYRRRGEDNARMVIRKIGCECVDWIHLA